MRKKAKSPKKKKKAKAPKVFVRMRVKKWRRVKRINKLVIPSDAFEQPGVLLFPMKIPTEIQLECVVGLDVTSEIPWKYINTQDITDSLITNGEESEFFPIENEIFTYPREKMLVIYRHDDLAEEHEFYICVTEEAEDNIGQIIKDIVQLREDNLMRMIYKTARPWVSLNSEIEVDALNDKNNRPFVLTEVECEYPPIQIDPYRKHHWKFRFSEDVQDGYTEILSTRTRFDNLEKVQIDAWCQAGDTVQDKETQTVATYNNYPKNNYSQYEYDLTFADSVSKEFLHNFKFFITYDLDALANMMDINGYIDLYVDDYKGLVRDESTTIIEDVSKMKTFSFFMDINYCKGKEISSVAWHPMWTGIAAVAYCNYSQSSYISNKHHLDEVTEAIYNTPPVLLWSFDDIVEPKLLLLTPREVTVVDFCPYDENILVGGCQNGQILIWDLKDRLEKVENKIVLTDVHQFYNVLMNSMTQWFQRSDNNKLVRCTVESELSYSHKSAVTVISWIDPFREITKCGIFQDIPEEEDRTSLQFMTSARDGTVLFWDLLAEPALGTSAYKPNRRKLRRLKKKPSALVLDVSPLRKFHRVLKPVYKIGIFEPGTTRALPMTCLNLISAKPNYVEVSPDPNRRFNILNRIKYRKVLKRPTYSLESKFVGGTTEGDFFIGTWDGFDYNSGAVVNKETCKFEQFAKYHDGPVVALSRSKLVSDLILTIGGTVFALWVESLPNHPIMWRRSRSRYTHGVWNYYRPSIFRLTRSDGVFEIWQLQIRTDCSIYTTSVSGNSLTGSSVHPLRMAQNVGAFADANGTLKLYYIAASLTSESWKDQEFIPKFCRREVERKTKLKEWQDTWVSKNTDFLQVQREIEEQRQKEEAAAKEKELWAAEEEQMKVAAQNKPKPSNYWENLKQNIVKQEIEYIQQSCLEKHGFVKEVLIKQRQPLVDQENEKIELKLKLKTRLKNAQDIFKENVKTLFPDVKKSVIPEADPYAKQETGEQELKYVERYEQLAEECDQFISNRPFTYYFNWNHLISRGKLRRRVLNHNICSHKDRILREINDQDEERHKMHYEDNAKSEESSSSITHDVSDVENEENLSQQLA